MTARPLVEEITPRPTVPQVVKALADAPAMILFDSALSRGELGRYSFLAVEPFETFVLTQPDYESDPLHAIRCALQHYRVETIEGLPPFQGGAAGMLSYDLGRCWERLPTPRWNEFALPACTVGLYAAVLAWDHLRDRCWFISYGFPETSPHLRQRHAQNQLKQIKAKLAASPAAPFPMETGGLQNNRAYPTDAAPRHTLDVFPGLCSNFSREGYLKAVERVIEHICAGDIFQANLSQRLLFPALLHPVEQYLRLRTENPAPFAGLLLHDDWAVLSSSPERFVRLSGNEVITRPIKGTRQRRPVPEADLYTRDELRESDKDQAENVMIVDLLRNDLSRVCQAGSIRVPELCTVEAYETVTHLVSEVRGVLRDDATFWNVIEATFPGGSITGAPKIRAMEIISEIEQVTRGAYCGSLFYCGFDGTADSNILIRTMTQSRGWLQLPVGGGIVAQSTPEQEYDETLHKARGMLRSLP